MAKYKIEYNPYRNVSIIHKDGERLPTNCKLRKSIKGKRLQEWFDEAPGWQGFARELEQDNRDKECKIEFFGREIDYNDLNNYFANYYSGKTKFVLSNTASMSEKDMLDKLESLISEIGRNDVITEEQRIELAEHLRRLKEDPFTISVIATMSSGKSTLLNAFLRETLLPTGDDPTTSNIVEITDNDVPGKFDLVGFDDCGNEIYRKENGTSEDVEEANKSVHILKISGDIPMVSINKMKLMLRDTPGPNNSQDKNHRKITESIIHDVKNMSTVLYVMNATNLRVDSDKELLENIAFALKNANQLMRERFFFVINKADARIIMPKQTLEALIKETKNYLYNEFGIENPRIFPVSASLASGIYELKNEKKLDFFRKMQIDNLITMFLQDDERVRFEKYSSTSQYVQRQIDGLLEKAIREGDKQEIALIHSGIVSLEYSIREYMEKYAYPIKVSEAVKDILATINQKEMETKFYNILTKDKDKLESVRKQIREIQSKKEEREERRDAFKKRIENYVLDKKIVVKAKNKMDSEIQKAIDSFEKAVVDDQIKKEFAEQEVAKLQKNFETIENNIQNDISESIQNEVISKCEEVLNEYKNYMNSVNEYMGNIDGFNFGKIKEISTNFDGIRTAADTVTKKEDEMHTEWIDDYKIHWGIIKLFKYKRPALRKTGKIIEYVDKKAIVDEARRSKTQVKDEIDAIFCEVEKKLQDFKDHYNSQISKLDLCISKVCNELERNTTNEAIAERQKENDEEQLNQLKNVIKNIEEITEI